jgi:TolA-binding protein
MSARAFRRGAATAALAACLIAPTGVLGQPAQPFRVGAPPPAAGAPPTVQPASPPVATETQAARAMIRIDGLERQIRTLTDLVERLEAQVTTQSAEIARLAKAVDAANAARVEAPAPTPAASEPAPAAAPAPPPEPQAQLSQARRRLETGDFVAAETALTRLLESRPDAPEALEARWLLGETLYVQSAWGPAAQAYVAYLRAAPEGPWAPQALIRLAGSFREIGQVEQRCAALAEFRRRAPRPDPTLKARADAEAARAPCAAG